MNSVAGLTAVSEVWVRQICLALLKNPPCQWFWRGPSDWKESESERPGSFVDSGVVLQDGRLIIWPLNEVPFHFTSTRENLVDTATPTKNQALICGGNQKI